MRIKDAEPKNIEQLEIGFDGRIQCPTRPRSRINRAGWWFRRMHHVVNCALDWTPVPSPRPEQTYLALVKSR